MKNDSGNRQEGTSGKLRRVKIHLSQAAADARHSKAAFNRSSKEESQLMLVI